MAHVIKFSEAAELDITIKDETIESLLEDVCTSEPFVARETNAPPATVMSCFQTNSYNGLECED